MKNEYIHMNCPPFPAFISCGRSFFKPGDVHVDRIFPTFVIMFIIRGIVHFKEGDKEYDLKSGEYFIQTPGIRHLGHKPSHDNAEYYWIHFMPLGSYKIYQAQDLNVTNGITVMDSGLGIRKPDLFITMKMNNSYPTGKWSNLLSELVQTFNVLQDPIKSQSLFTELIGLISGEKDSKTLYEKDIIADLVHQYIKANYKNKINLKTIASELHFTPDYVARCFKQRFGSTPSEYIVQLKMDYARNALISTNKCIESIAYELGYTDFAVFSRMFKHFEGISPLKYRNKIWGK